MDVILSELKEKLQKSSAYLKTELGAMRIGTAQASFLEDLQIVAYGTTMRLVELASIKTPEPHLMIVQLWDVALVEIVENAIRNSKLDLNPVVEGNLIRVPVPPLSEERRRELIKLVIDKVEEAKVAVRNIRRDAIRRLTDTKEEGRIGEDAEFRLKKMFQIEVDRVAVEIVELGKMKEEELMRV